MKIIIYGSGCKTCKTLYENVKKVVEDNGITAEVIHENDINNTLQKGILSLPALEVDGVIKSKGRALKPKDILPLLI